MLPMQKEKSIVLACPKCGQETKRSNPVVQKLNKPRESIVVIGNEGKSIQTLPKMKVTCQKCGHGEAFYWMVQTAEATRHLHSSSDAPNADEHGESIHETRIVACNRTRFNFCPPANSVFSSRLLERE